MPNITCPNCSGHGSFEETCTICNGSGEGLHESLICWCCGGSGVMTIKCSCDSGNIPYEEYEVFASWNQDEPSESIGSIDLPDIDQGGEMPISLEINGFTYIIEDTKEPNND